MHPAFQTWDNESESLESIEDRIHDGVPRAKLKVRAAGYLTTFGRLFPWSLPGPGSQIMEVGSGLAYVMEAAAERFAPNRIVGLDVASHMIDTAKRRLERDGSHDRRFEFRHYDGVSIPFEDNSFDFVYSVAAIQHIPKPHAYNLFFEINRVLKPSGFAALHMLSFSLLPSHTRLFPMREEVLRQIRNEAGHWHLFYSKQELLYLLSAGVEVGWLSVREELGSLWTTFSKDRQVTFCNDTVLTAC